MACTRIPWEAADAGDNDTPGWPADAPADSGGGDPSVSADKALTLA